MVIKLISGALILFSAFMGVRHGWNGLNLKPGDTGPFATFQQKLGLSKGAVKIFAALTILSGVLLLPPQTFVLANILNTALFVFLVIRFLLIGDTKAALTEVPFLVIPVLLLLFKHPFAIK